MALAQDADGVLWVGTLDGLASFDGLAQDRRGRIWADSSGGQVAFGTADTPWTV